MSIIPKTGLRYFIAIGLFVGSIGMVAPAMTQELLQDWDLSSAISLRGGYENENGLPSYFVVAAPEFTLQRQGDDFTANLSANMQLDQMDGNQFAPRSLGLQGNYGLRLNQNAQLDFGLTYDLSQPRSSDPDLPTGVKVAGHQQQADIGASYAHQFSKTGVQLRGGIGRSQTGASLLNDDSFQSNSDQNAWNYTIGGRVTREISPMISAFVDAQVNRARYDEGSTALTASRNNWSYEAQLGASLNFDERLSGDVSVGQLRQSFDDTSLAPVQTLTYNAALQWQATERSLLSLDVNTSTSPSTVVGEATQIVDVGRLTLNQQLNSRLQLSVFGELERQHYQTSVDEIRTSRAGLVLQYQANKQLSAFANYSFALREEPTKVVRNHKIEAGLRFNRQ